MGRWLCVALVALLPVCLAPPVPAQEGRAARLVEEGTDALHRGDTREAEARFTQAVLADRSYIPARIALGSVALDAGDLGSAESQFRVALRLAPENLEARYFQGMVKREQGRHRPPLMGWLLDEFRDAREHFTFVIERDSTFRDVVYQFALLQQYRGDSRLAVQLAYRQIAMKPDDPAALAGFFRMVRMYAALQGDKVDAWAADLPVGFRKLVDAEVARRAGDLEHAQTLLLELLQNVGPVPRPSVHVLLSRIFSGRGHPEAAEVQFWSAVDAIESPADAALIFDEIKYVLRDEELRRYDTLSVSESFKRFFRSIWVQRDPMPAAAANARLEEHLRRLDHAELSYEHYRPRTFFNDPDVRTTLDFGRVYVLNHNFNDKGLVFIRHGPPQARIFTGDETGAVGQALGNTGSTAFDVTTGRRSEPIAVETWRYYASGDQPEMIFHFGTRAGGNWRLMPAPMSLQALHDRRELGAAYAEAFQAVAGGAQLEIPRLQMQMQREAQEYVDLGLETDRHSWSSDVRPLQMPAALFAFRGPDRSTQVDVYYAFPTSQLASYRAEDGFVAVEVGLSVMRDDWTGIVNRRDKKLVRPSLVESDVAVGSFTFEVEPDTYTVSMHVKPEGTPLLGGWKSEYVFSDYASGGLSMSDLLLASSIEPSGGDDPFLRRGLRVVPSFTGHFRTDQPVHVYYELYNLALDGSDNTRYVTTIEIRPASGRARGLLGLFRRGNRPVLSLRTEGSSSVVSPIEYTEIDMSDVEPGSYVLLVRVQDEVASLTVERSQVLELLPP